jgi:perosamine synthetase
MSNDIHLKYSRDSILNVIEYLSGSNLNKEAEKNWVKEFEDTFASLSGHEFNISVNSGTSALHAALSAFGITKDDEVIMPALSVVMNAYAAIALRAKPIFADVNEKTWNIDLDAIKKVVSDRTKAIITVSWFGLPVDMDPIVKFAKAHNIFVLEDAAESLGATYKGLPNGVLADAVAYSFENKKHLTTGGEGGMISTSNPEIAKKARKFSGLGYKHLTADTGRTSLANSIFQRPDYERYDSIGLNYRMSPVTAAIGLGQLTHFSEILKVRIFNGKSLCDLITKHEDFNCQLIPENSTHAFYTAGIIYSGKESWAKIYELVIKNGGDGFYGNVLNPYLEPVFIEKSETNQAWNKNLCPVAEQLQPKIMAIKTNFRRKTDLDRNLEAWNKTLISIS